MKYDRPVWQLMHACADALAETFRYDDVRTWFAENYPEIGEATIRAHVVGLTEGGAKHPQFERRAPIFRRVERGVYAPIPFDERGELPEDDPADDSSAPVRFTVAAPSDVESARRDLVSLRDSETIEASQLAAQQGIDADRRRLAAESEEVERAAMQEKRRSRKAARKEGETADMLARENDDHQQAATSVRDELARLEQEALMRIEIGRAEHDQLDSEQNDREQQERDLLDREQRQLYMTLSPILDDESTPQPPPIPEPARDDRPSDRFGADASGDPDVSPGGIVIVRAPRNTPAPDVDPVVDATSPEGVVPTPEEYEAVRDLDAEGSDPPATDAVLLGSIGARLTVPAPARDAFCDLAFQRARLDAELSGSRWFVLSAEHGLLEPEEWMSPDERAMTDIEPNQLAVWASWVVARLESLVGKLPGQLVQVEAPGFIAEPVLGALRRAGAAVFTGPADPLLRPHPDAQVMPFARGGSIPEHLSDASHAVPASSAGALPHHPGLYAWTVDRAGSRDLNRALRLPVRAGVIFVGQVGGGTGLLESASSLHDQIARVQLHGPARSSTFRMTLATALSGLLGLRTIEDPQLTQWMLGHLSIAVWPTVDLANLHELNATVVDSLRPVLNIDGGHDTEYRDRIAELSDRLE